MQLDYRTVQSGTGSAMSSTDASVVVPFNAPGSGDFERIMRSVAPDPQPPAPADQAQALPSAPQPQPSVFPSPPIAQNTSINGMQAGAPLTPLAVGYVMTIPVAVAGYIYMQPVASQAAQPPATPGNTTPQPATAPGTLRVVSPGVLMQPTVVPGMAPTASSSALLQAESPFGVSMQPAITTPQTASVATHSTSLQPPFQVKADVTQGFGPTIFSAEPPYGGYAHFHTGIDFGLPPGTAVDAAAAGRVVAAGWDSSGFGLRVVIDHGNGIRTLYGHLESIGVAPGDAVQAGQEIGLSGSTGNSTGPHLHFGVERNGRWVDPTPYLQPQGGNASAAATGASSPASSVVTPAPVVGDQTPGLIGTGAPIGGGQSDTGPSPAPTTAQSATSPAVLNFSNLIRQVSLATGVPSSLLSSVMHAESGGDPRAVSPASAKGLMQLTDPVASAYGVSDVFDPEQNLLGGALYLRTLLQRYSGNETLALAAYNAGPGAVDQYGGIPPYRETQSYVQRVLALQQQYAAAP